jgi:16S rRNA (guanine1207-N2)-methyltransferase
VSERGGHYFDADPASRSARTTVRLDLPDRSLELVTDRGVFSADRVDPGTRYLLLEAPAPPASGTFVDLGAGYGPIACTLALRSPAATVWAVEVNQRARELCALNADRAGAGNVRVAAPEEVPADVVVDVLWSNPPIRIGKAALHDLLAGWLARLTPDGTAVLVVQKHLGADSLTRWLIEQGHDTTRLGSRAGYRLLQVSPKAGVPKTDDRGDAAQPPGGAARDVTPGWPEAGVPKRDDQ